MSTADKLNKVLETKEAIKQAIIDKGGTVGDVFAEYPTAIQNIQGGGGSGTFVVPKDVRFAYSSDIEEFPEDWDWSEINKSKIPGYLFYYCMKLKQIPKLKFADLQSGAQMFGYCYQVTDIDTSEWNTSNLINTQGMFSRTGIITNPPLNTSKVTTMREMFSNCTNLTEIKDLDTSSATVIDSLFGSCTKLQAASELDCSKITSNISSYNSPFYNCTALRNFDGFKGLKVNMYLDKCYSLSYESLMNVINKLADGVSGKTLYLAQDSVNQLSDDDIAVATNKGWTISPAKTITSAVIVTDLTQVPSSSVMITPRTYDFSQYTGIWGPNNINYKYTLLPCRGSMFQFEADITNTTDASYMFGSGNNIRYIILHNTHNVTNMQYMFRNCDKLVEVRMDGDVSNVENVTGMFEGVTSEGTFYYNPAYDYSTIIAELPATWTAVPLTE